MEPTCLTDRLIIRLSPQDQDENVRGFLQGLVTSDVAAALPAWSALLTPQGKVLFDFIVWDGGDSLLIDCEGDAAPALIKRLSMYRLRRKIGIAIDRSIGVHWRAGDGSSPDPRLAALGQRWLGAPDDASADAAWRAHRLKQGVCEGAAELHDLLWLECNAAELGGVSFSKGCYVGQENTARMNWRQKVNRRLVVVPIEQSDPARQRASYPACGLAVDHRRIEDIPADALPAWLQQVD